MTYDPDRSPVVPAPRPDADPWLDELLRADGEAHRHDYISDDGFTARVAAALPPPAMLPRWRRPALVGLWAVGGIGAALAAPGLVAAVAREVIRVLGGQPVAPTEIAAGILLAAVAAYSAAAITLRDA